jgi:hypothetical protein
LREENDMIKIQVKDLQMSQETQLQRISDLEQLLEREKEKMVAIRQRASTLYQISWSMLENAPQMENGTSDRDIASLLQKTEDMLLMRKSELADKRKRLSLSEGNVTSLTQKVIQLNNKKRQLEQLLDSEKKELTEVRKRLKVSEDSAVPNQANIRLYRRCCQIMKDSARAMEYAAKGELDKCDAVMHQPLFETLTGTFERDYNQVMHHRNGNPSARHARRGQRQHPHSQRHRQPVSNGQKV